MGSDEKQLREIELGVGKEIMLRGLLTEAGSCLSGMSDLSHPLSWQLKVGHLVTSRVPGGITVTIRIMASNARKGGHMQWRRMKKLIKIARERKQQHPVCAFGGKCYKIFQN